MNEAEVTIRGGFPLLVKFKVYGPEPDVGIFGQQIEIWEILTPKGQSAEFLNITEREEDEITEQLFDKLYDMMEDYRY